MKIIEFRAENIKNLRAVEIRPDGTVILSGKNGAGKSAVLESIEVALTGKKLEEPIRTGEGRAEINLDLGKYKVKKVLTPKGARLEVTGAEGAAYPSPQALLDGIVGELSFDPLAFAELGKTKAGEREQREVLARLVGLDFSKIDEKRQELYDERTVRFREIKGMDPSKYSSDPTKPLAIDALIGDMEKPAKTTPRVEISMAEEIAKVDALEKKAATFQEYERRRCGFSNEKAAAESNIGDLKAEIVDLEKQIAERRGAIETEENTIRNINDALGKMVALAPEAVSPEQMATARQALVEVDEKNKSIRAAIAYDKRVEQLQESKAEIDRLTREMDRIDREKKEAVAAAKFPIAGLAIDDLRVTYEGKPLSQLSTGEQIRVSAAVAMALNPNLRVIFVRDASLLDSNGTKELMNIAVQKDYQLWLEKIDETGKVGVYLEEGEVVSVDGEAVGVKA